MVVEQSPCPTKADDTYDASPHVEHASSARNRIDNGEQPALRIVHRQLANAAPLGLLSFATGIFLMSSFGVHARGVQTPNLMISVLIFFGGICQYFVGIMEFVSGNTFGTTVFASYGAFNLSYAVIYLPGSGILSAYTDAQTGAIDASFNQAIALYLWAWFILTGLLTIGAMRSSWVLLMVFIMLDFCLALLAAGFMADSASVLTAGYAFGYVVAFLSYWAGIAGLYEGLTPFKVPMFPLAT